MYSEGRVNRIFWQDVCSVWKKEVKDNSKTYSLSNWKDGVTFTWDGEDNMLNLGYLSNIEVKYMNGKLTILV